jgi:hypothetical protein
VANGESRRVGGGPHEGRERRARRSVRRRGLHWTLHVLRHHGPRLATLLMVLAPWAPPAAGELIKVGPPGFEVESLSSWKGRTVRSIELSGNRHTKEHVIRREIRTEVGEPLDLDLLAHDLVRLENLSIFADVRVEAERRSGDGVALRFVFKESPTFIPFPAYTYTEENGFSVGAGVSIPGPVDAAKR